MATTNAEIVVRRPHPALRRYVARYVGYRQVGLLSGVHRGLPSHLPTFIIRLEDPRAFVAGLRTSPVLVPHDGCHHGVAVELTVRGSRALFGLPTGALREDAVELTDLAGKSMARLADRMAGGGTSWEERFSILDAALLGSLEPRCEPPPEVIRGFEVLLQADGCVGVEDLATSVGWSRRHFSGVFAREIGLPPRQLARVLRFERSRRWLVVAPRLRMTEVALRAGYFDHAHMLHEWQRLAGCRPDQWLAEEFLSVQAEAARQG